MESRNATADDLHSLADIACAAFPEDPQWDYRFPRRREYPQDTWKCTRQMYNRFLTDPEDNNYLVRVITSQSNEDDRTVKPVALAVWELQYMKEGAIPKGMSSRTTRVIWLFLTSLDRPGPVPLAAGCRFKSHGCFHYSSCGSQTDILR